MDDVRRLLAPFWGRPDTAGVFSDFDGTLAPIVDDPAVARALPGAPEVLRALARQYARVGVVSGRPVTFLRNQLGGEGLFLAGLYGLEMWAEDGPRPRPEADEWRPAVEEAAAGADAALAGSGVAVERKGLTVTLHFRMRPDAESEARDWAATEAERSGLVVHEGRMSLELKPPVLCDKGTVVREAASGLSAVCFLGDDKGDLAAFDALDGLAAEGAVTLAVAIDSTEAPPELKARAGTVLGGPEEALSFLQLLLDGP